MVKVFRIPPWAGIFVLLFILFLIVASLPLFLIASGVLITLSLFRASTKPREIGAGTVVRNKKIGDYRLKADENDPSVIEVIDP